jgi:hypothetical protein
VNDLMNNEKMSQPRILFAQPLILLIALLE